MSFNNDKFEALRYGNDEDIKSLHHYVTSDGKEINEFPHVRDLGVSMSSDGTFSDHITNIRDSANNLVGWVLRTFRTRSKIPMLTLWKSIIRPKLDYCSQLWNPTATGLIQSLEQVQKRFIRCITGMGDMNYWQQLKYLDLYSLERRRERYIIIYVWKVIEGLAPNIDCNNRIETRQNARFGRQCIDRTNIRRTRCFDYSSICGYHR